MNYPYNIYDKLEDLGESINLLCDIAKEWDDLVESDINVIQRMINILSVRYNMLEKDIKRLEGSRRVEVVFITD
jgi:hypothetical protein